MIDYTLAIIVIFVVLLFGILGYIVPLLGMIGGILGLIILVPLAITPTVIMGTGFNSGTGLTYIVTETIIELRMFSIFVLLMCISGTILGITRRR